MVVMCLIRKKIKHFQLQLRRLTEACEITQQCNTTNPDAECKEAWCRCKMNYWRVDDDSCLRMAARLGERCSIDAQCMGITGSECKAAGFCWCNGTQVQVDGRRMPQSVPMQRRRRQIGERDRESRQIPMQSCMPRRNLGETCRHDMQCSIRTNNSICLDTSRVCGCTTGFVQRSVGVCV